MAEGDELRAELAVVKQSRRRLLDAADGDRQAIERALQDGLQQDLVAISAYAQLLSRHAPAGDAAAQAVDDLKRAVRDALQHAADLAETIHPPLLGWPALASAIRASAQRVGIAATVDVIGATTDLNPTLNSLYWCCVEAMAGVSAGGDATVAVRYGGAEASFQVDVSGSYRPEAFERLRDRVEALGGRVEIVNSDRGGFSVYGTLPVS
jgi:signal transduction histidine kinase